MARITFVKSAQQRYDTKPVIDPATGQQKRVPVMRKDGTQKTTSAKKGSRPIFRNITERDLDKPLPMPECDYPKCEHPSRTIQPGESYMWIAPKSGPYGGRALRRHADHPRWNVWEYSYSTSAQVARISNDIENMLATYEFTTVDDFEDAVQQAAEMAAELRDEKEEALNNMPEGLQDGSQTQEQHEALEAWVDEIEQAQAPDEDNTCTECEGTGQVDDDTDVESEEQVDCDECGGTGEVDGVSEDWAEAAREAIMDAVNNCGV